MQVTRWQNVHEEYEEVLRHKSDYNGIKGTKWIVCVGVRVLRLAVWMLDVGVLLYVSARRVCNACVFMFVDVCV